jgi:hypothetical protein
LVFIYSTGHSCPVLMKFEFSRHIFENTQISHFMKIRLVRASSFMQTDRRTDMSKLIVAFRDFANSPKSYTMI